MKEQMEMIILPLTHKGKAEKQNCIHRCFDLAKEVKDEKVQTFLLSGILVFSDKVITKEDSKQIKEWIMMTKVAQLFEEEKIAYAEERAKEAAREASKNEVKKTAKALLKKGFPFPDILEILPDLTEEELKNLK